MPDFTSEHCAVINFGSWDDEPDRLPDGEIIRCLDENAVFADISDQAFEVTILRCEKDGVRKMLSRVLP